MIVGSGVMSVVGIRVVVRVLVGIGVMTVGTLVVGSGVMSVGSRGGVGLGQVRRAGGVMSVAVGTSVGDGTSGVGGRGARSGRRRSGPGGTIRRFRRESREPSSTVG